MFCLLLVISVEIVPATVLNCDVQHQKHPKLFSGQRREASGYERTRKS